MTTLPSDNMYPCSYKPEPRLPNFPKPDHGMDLITESKLERFLDKVDANDDGDLSRKELSEAADTNNDGFVSKTEKKEMKAKLQEYMRDDNAIRRLDSETLGKAKQMLEFLDDDASPFIRPDLEDMIKNFEINKRLD